MADLIRYQRHTPICSDFGRRPLMIARIFNDATAIGVGGLLGGLIALSIGGFPALALWLFATLNDWRYCQSEDEPIRYTSPPIDVEPISSVAAPRPSTIETVSVPAKQGTPGFIADMGHNRRSTLIVGVPGAGKGLVTSNVIRQVRKYHPGIQVVGIDPKNSDKESGYWSSGYDKVFRFSLSAYGSGQGLEEFQSALAYFRSLSGEKLLIIDEGLSVMRCIKSDSNALREFNDWLTFMTSMGDSEGQHVWMLSQTGNLKDLGLDSSIRACFDILAIMKAGNDALLQGLLRTDLMPQGKASSPDSVKRAIADSPVGRGYYFSRIGRWAPMPRLENHSGYDRDARQWLNDDPWR